jgi:nucleotide-binding universal stress UspA family protein
VINKMLLAVDESEGSHAAERLAEELGRNLFAEVVVLHVREWVFGPSGPFDEGPRRSYLAAERVAGRLCDHGLRARPEVRSAFFWSAARAIVEVARREGVDLIIMGCHREAGHRRSLLSGVTDRVLQMSTLPVLVTGPSPVPASRASGDGERRRRGREDRFGGSGGRTEGSRVG